MRDNALSAAQRREPTIRRLVEKYNGLCKNLSTVIQQYRAPRGARVPCSINYEGIFQLDIDNDIWQDAGLHDDDVDAPAWLVDENTRKGINLLLQLDRCTEEEFRLRMECCILLEWVLVEEEAVCKAYESHGNHIFAYISNIC